jgi:hypothetical protein
MEYGSETQNVLFVNIVLSHSCTDWFSYIFIFRKQFYFVVSGLKITGHGNPDNNLEWTYIISSVRMIGE